MLGYAVSASTIAAVMNGCTSDAVVGADDGWVPVFLTKDEVKVVKALSETILPKTETPGAIEAGVHQYIDVMIGQNRTATQQKSFRDGLAAFASDYEAAAGKTFLKASSDEQNTHVAEIDEKTRAEMENRSGRRDRPFYMEFKELTFVGYFTSELIGENYLNYDPVPGAYHGCIPLEETGGKVWSL